MMILTGNSSARFYCSCYWRQTYSVPVSGVVIHECVSSISQEGPVARWQTYFHSDVTTSRQRGLRRVSRRENTHISKTVWQKASPVACRDRSITLTADSILCHHFHKQINERMSRALWSDWNPAWPKRDGGQCQAYARGDGAAFGLTTSDHITLEQGRPDPVLKGHNPAGVSFLKVLSTWTEFRLDYGPWRPNLDAPEPEGPWKTHCLWFPKTPVIWQVNNSVQDELSTQSTLLSERKNSIID